MKAVHISQLRDALVEAYVAAELGTRTFTEVLIPGITPIHAFHINDLREAVRDLYEATPPTGRYKIGPDGCYWEPNDAGPNQCDPETGRFKIGPYDECYWEPNDSGPDQCTPDYEGEDSETDPDDEANGDDSNGDSDPITVTFELDNPNEYQAIDLPAFHALQMSTDQKKSIRVVIRDQFGALMPNELMSVVPTAYALPEHVHNIYNSPFPPPGSVSPVFCDTGGDGQQCVITYHSNKIAGSVFFRGTITAGPHSGWFRSTDFYVQVGPYRNGSVLDNRLENYGLEGVEFELIGETTEHPDNHYCIQRFCDGLVQLAQDYHARYPAHKLAFNDLSLKRGGVFDWTVSKANSNERKPWQGPHSCHRRGEDADVRSNGNTWSVPHDAEVHRWLLGRIRELMRRPAQYHDQQTNNPVTEHGTGIHIHIFLGPVPTACG